MIGQRLRLSRAAAGLSLRALASKIDNRVTAQAIGKYERDESMPNSTVLIALADALDVSMDWLLSRRQTALAGVEFPKAAGLSRREEARVEAQALHLVERYTLIEKFLGLETEWDRPWDPPYPVARDPSEAERAACSLRDRWCLGLDPIPNMVELLEERGIKVLPIDSGRIGGLTARVRREDRPALPVFVVNRNERAERTRFVLAQELGRSVMAVDPKLDAERAARRFAGAFLMPAEAMWSEVGKRRTSASVAELLRLKRRFGASCQAIAQRCRDLGIFGESLHRDLAGQFRRLGWSSSPYKEDGSLPPESEVPGRFARLCYRAISERAVSEAKAAELLGIPARKLHRRMGGPGVSFEAAA